MKKLIASAAIAATAFAGTAGMASAQSPIVANNLVGVNVSGVNVNLVDVVDANVQAIVPIGIVANVCGVNVAVLAEIIDSADPTCEADNSQRSQQALRNIERFSVNN